MGQVSVAHLERHVQVVSIAEVGVTTVHAEVVSLVDRLTHVEITGIVGLEHVMKNHVIRFANVACWDLSIIVTLDITCRESIACRSL